MLVVIARAVVGAQMIRLLIVDDQPTVRQGLHMLLTSESDLSVVGEACCGESASTLPLR